MTGRFAFSYVKLSKMLHFFSGENFSFDCCVSGLKCLQMSNTNLSFDKGSIFGSFKGKFGITFRTSIT